MLTSQDKFLLYINAYLNAGIRENASIEATRKATVVNLFAFVGFSITSTLAFFNIINGSWVLSVPLVIAAALFLTSHLLLRLSYSPKAYIISSTLLQCILLTLCLYLALKGGKNGTGPLWIYLIPPVVLFFSGLKNGLIIIGVFTLSFSFITFCPDNFIGAYNYTNDFKTRILYSFLTLVFLASFYEYSREVSFSKFTALTKELELQATLDPLTQLLNRRGLLDRFTYEISRSLRNRKPLSVIIIDIDYFKNINDHYGHDIGDKTLEALAQLFSRGFRKQDYIARWGGEEFLLLLPETNLEQASALAEKIRQCIELKTFNFHGIELQFTISLGVAESEKGLLAQEIISLADQRLYIAKEHGRNRVVDTDHFTPQTGLTALTNPPNN